jgi:hypothetical protein
MKPAKKVIVVFGFSDNDVLLEALKQNTDREIVSKALGGHAYEENARKLLATKLVAAKCTSILIFGINDVLSMHNYLCAEKRVKNAIRNQGKRICIVSKSDLNSVDQIGFDWNLPYALGCAEHCRPGVYVVKQSRCYNQGAYDAESF